MDTAMGLMEAILLMGGLGVIVGIGLAIASKVFYVYVDPLILAIDDVLPGANCGGCGYPGCISNAEAVAAGKSGPDSCVAAGPDTAEAIASLLGISVEAKEPDIALPGCTYSVAEADTKFTYHGMQDCRAAALLNGGMKVCNIGCLGLGTCAKTCPFNAITMGPKGLPVVHQGRCTGCGACERVCPKNIITLSSVTRRILKEYTTEDCTTPCQRACPAGINISAYIGAMAKGDHLKAVQIIKERNPFPAVIGRICPRPCENECRRQYVDEPVAINFLKRYAADYEKKRGKHILPYKAPETNRRVAVIGGGVEGLSTAFFVSRMGHSVTLYESQDQLGGLLRTAIARYRLPGDILDWDINGIMAMGVKTQTNAPVGTKITLGSLLNEGYEAIFLAVGGWDSRLVRTAGKSEISPMPGCHLLIDVLKSGQQGYPSVDLKGHTVIVGNPNLTPEMIERCKKLGAGPITVLVREPDLTSVQMPGVEIQEDTSVSRLYGQDNQLEGIEIVNLSTNERKKIKAAHLIFSAGRLPELIAVPQKPETDENQVNGRNDKSQTNAWEAFPPYKQPDYHQQTGLMAAGDIVTDFSAAIRAIAAGRRAAATIHQSIYELDIDLPDNVVTALTAVQNVNKVFNVEAQARQIMPVADASKTAAGFELEKGFSPMAAEKEANRCLQCGLICYLKNDLSDTSESATGS
ncbi:MAG: RnfABCDGE type electron transport complex subunit B [Desulfobacteraceae bacterium]|nr:RnfABCDGE type electron transport complex subunit B [Desulfobacteraceae bacterium]